MLHLKKGLAEQMHGIKMISFYPAYAKKLVLKLPCQNVCAAYGTYNTQHRTDTSQRSPGRCREKPLSADVLMPLPRHPRTTRGNTVLSGFFEQMGRMREKGEKWWLARESLGGTRWRNVLWGGSQRVVSAGL